MATSTSETSGAAPPAVASRVLAPRPVLAIVTRLAAAAMLSLMFTIVKILNARGVSLFETVLYRQLLSLPFIVVWMAMGAGLAQIRTQRPRAHAMRAAVGLSGMALNFLAMRMLPLAEATTIAFAMPIFATVLAALVLREPTGRFRWTAVLVGFIGVVIVARPTGADMHPLATMVALLAAFVTAVVTIVIRQLTSTEPVGTTVFWFTAYSSMLLLPFLPFFGQAHDVATWAWIIGLGLVGGISQILLTAALKMAPVAVVIPMDYTSLLWATLFGWLAFSTLPLATTLLGAPIIIASGIAILWREHHLGRLRAAAATATAVSATE